MLWAVRGNTCVLLSQHCFHLVDSSHEYLKMNLLSHDDTLLLLWSAWYYKRGVYRVSKLVNHTWPVSMIQNWGWEVGAHVPPNILVVCHTVKFTFILAVCSLHPYDTIYCLDLTHVVGFLFYVSFFTLSVYKQHQWVIYTHFSKWYSTFFVCFVLFWYS